ncbi:hypothetical protein OEZ86_014273 [Tetradesmus obliquus]|nr:hypothetical protein OEZ86_014273 [Tetradesmus obliquus]
MLHRRMHQQLVQQAPQVLLHPPRAAVHGSEALSLGCVREVLGFYAELAADSAKDFQLVAACAEDIVTHCPRAATTRLFICLVHHKHLVKRHCSAALETRLAASAGLFKWDQDLAASCSRDADDWCGDEQASDARLPSAGGFTISCLRQGTLGGIQDQIAGAVEEQEEGHGDLSKGCATALFRRQMAEAEDVRFSFDLSRGCSQELGLHCSSAKPGSGEAVLCLERQLPMAQLGEECEIAVQNTQLMRAADGRLDWRLRQLCRDDVGKLCKEAQYAGGLDSSLMLDDWDAPPTAGMNVTMCLRRKWQAISSEPCKAHVRHLAAQAFANTLLDAPLLRACAANISQHCLDASAALVCLKGLLANGLALASGCAAVLQERLLEAADNFDLLPDVGAACKVERRMFCEGVPAAHGAVLDCLADFQDDARFGDECRDALTSQFMLAVGDIRLLSSLRSGCAADAAKLCPKVQPGSGRVIGCLQQHSSDVQSSSCRRQLMRLQGFAAHDYRLDYHLRQACSADVAKHCVHVVPGSGRVHACLRQNEAKLSQQCKQQVETAEAREHQDVSLNPIIRAACQSTITSLCGKLSSSITQLLPCLKTHMASPSFAPSCKEALTAALSRKGRKQEVAAEVHRELMVYVPGMPLTAACDGDAKQMCAAGSAEVSAMLQPGSLLVCLAAQPEKLSRNCWAVMSLFDRDQLVYTNRLARGPGEGAGDVMQLQELGTAGLQQQQQQDMQKAVLEKVSQQVQSQLQGQLNSQLNGQLSTQLERYVQSIQRGAESSGFLWGVLASPVPGHQATTAAPSCKMLPPWSKTSEGNGTGAEAAVVPAQSTQITVYEFCNYGGRAGVASAGNYASLASPFNDFISSVRVPAGMTAVFWENNNFGGRGLRVTGPADVPCFDNWQFSKVTSSMQITSSNSGGGGGGGGGSGGVDAQLLALVNQARAQAGLRALSIDARLNAAALAHSQDQARRQTMSHTGHASTPAAVQEPCGQAGVIIQVHTGARV